jgi:hypothetical protein
MQILLQSYNGKTIVLDVGCDDTVLLVKEKIQCKEGIPWHEQRLIFEGKSLGNEDTLLSYNIRKDSTVYLVSETNSE